MSGELFPVDTTIEILSVLPVETLMRFKCVCRSWYAIISSADFISNHLKNHSNNPANDRLLAQYCNPLAADLEFLKFSLDPVSPRIVSYKSLRGGPIKNSEICGPCNGIFYLEQYSRRGDHRALWNPATNELKSLPPLIKNPNLPSNVSYNLYNAYGFGFDPANNDYKVVVIKECCEVNPYPSSVFVYSLNADSWRYWGDLVKYWEDSSSIHLENNKSYIYLNETVFWLGTIGTFHFPELIVSFNMSTELFRGIKLPYIDTVMPFPDYDIGTSVPSLALYHDSLALFVVEEMEELLKIWTYGTRQWTKKFTVGPISGIGQPVGCWKHGKIILECRPNNKLTLCDPITGEVRDLGYEGGNMCSSSGIFVYRETLLSFKHKKWTQATKGS